MQFSKWCFGRQKSGICLENQSLRKFYDDLQEYFSKRGDSGEVDLNQEVEGLIILTASRGLLGEVRNKLFDDVLTKLFVNLLTCHTTIYMRFILYKSQLRKFLRI